jgi:hypothetical protein
VSYYVVSEEGGCKVVRGDSGMPMQDITALMKGWKGRGWIVDFRLAGMLATVAAVERAPVPLNLPVIMVMGTNTACAAYRKELEAQWPMAAKLAHEAWEREQESRRKEEESR